MAKAAFQPATLRFFFLTSYFALHSDLDCIVPTNKMNVYTQQHGQRCRRYRTERRSQLVETTNVCSVRFDRYKTCDRQ